MMHQLSHRVVNRVKLLLYEVSWPTLLVYLIKSFDDPVAGYLLFQNMDVRVGTSGDLCVESPCGWSFNLLWVVAYHGLCSDIKNKGSMIPHSESYWHRTNVRYYYIWCGPNRVDRSRTPEVCCSELCAGGSQRGFEEI